MPIPPRRHRPQPAPTERGSGVTAGGAQNPKGLSLVAGREAPISKGSRWRKRPQVARASGVAGGWPSQGCSSTQITRCSRNSRTGSGFPKLSSRCGRISTTRQSRFQDHYRQIGPLQRRLKQPIEAILALFQDRRRKAVASCISRQILQPTQDQIRVALEKEEKQLVACQSAQAGRAGSCGDSAGCCASCACRLTCE